MTRGRLAPTALRTCALLACALLATGCALGRDYIGTELRADPTLLRPGKTRIGEVMALFGAPNQIQRRHNGEILIYRYVRHNNSQLEIEEPIVTGAKLFTYTKRQRKANQLTLFFDENGVLTGFGHTDAIDELDFL